MIFSKELPKTPGWYWMRFPGDKVVVATRVAEACEAGRLTVEHHRDTVLLADWFIEQGFLFGVEAIPVPTVELEP